MLPLGLAAAALTGLALSAFSIAFPAMLYLGLPFLSAGQTFLLSALYANVTGKSLVTAKSQAMTIFLAAASIVALTLLSDPGDALAWIYAPFAFLGIVVAVAVSETKVVKRFGGLIAGYESFFSFFLGGTVLSPFALRDFVKFVVLNIRHDVSTKPGQGE
ncbi:MAG: hypothetical protein LBT40_08600 [Deltaproteobacteria bacterium]|jgi:hypothetical protein|nr:hypothetical protein [Deltaproteobacteria bacterium]